MERQTNSGYMRRVLLRIRVQGLERISECRSFRVLLLATQNQRLNKGHSNKRAKSKLKKKNMKSQPVIYTTAPTVNAFIYTVNFAAEQEATCSIFPSSAISWESIFYGAL